MYLKEFLIKRAPLFYERGERLLKGGLPASGTDADRHAREADAEVVSNRVEGAPDGFPVDHAVGVEDFDFQDGGLSRELHRKKIAE
jgi:hypothetical protein